MDERKLIKRCQNGEKQAFNEIVEKYSPYVSKFLLKLTKDEELSEDLLQETFIKIIRSIDRFDIHGQAKFPTYIIAIAKNCYVDYLRRNKKIEINIDEVTIEDKIQVESQILKQMQVNEVLEVINNLPFEQAQAIKMKYLEELTLKEIAEKFQTEPKTIKSRIHSGVMKLRKHLLAGGSMDGRKNKEIINKS